MAARLGSLKSRLIVTVIGVHAILLPILFFVVSDLLVQSHRDAFIDQVRLYSRFLVDSLESKSMLVDQAEEMLDEVMLNGIGLYAELTINGGTFRSSLSVPDDSLQFREDFMFGDHNDGIYFLSIPVVMNAGTGILKLGFDEQPIINQIALVRNQLLVMLTVYLLVVLLLTLVFSSVIARPIRQLRRASQIITSGKHDEKLSVTSSISEFNLFSRDLEHMRSELVGVNEQLASEIALREQAESEREQMRAGMVRAQKIETLGTFSGGIAHEFNNVLTPMILYLDLAIEDAADDKQMAEDLSRVLKLARRGKSLVSRILTFSHQNSSMDVRRVNVAVVAQTAIDLLRAIVPSTISLEFKPPTGDRLEVFGDPEELDQVVVNLCNNAVLAIEKPQGKVVVEVEAVQQTGLGGGGRDNLPPGSYVRIKVSDDGVGMSDEQIERIFEPFYTTREVGKGTGLGLSVVYGIVLAHGGQINVRSKVGEGTVFEVYLLALNDWTVKKQVMNE